MAKVKMPCLFDNSKKCPARTAMESVPLKRDWDLTTLAKNVCPICPTRLNMLKGKAGFGEM